MTLGRFLLAGLLAIALPSVVLYAQNSKYDRSQPLVVEADGATYTDITQTSVFTGSVILKQGSMVITADHVETIVDPEGYQYATASMEKGGLVKFTQKREGTNEVMKAQGNKLIYDGKQNLIVLSNKAQMQRYSAAGKLLDQINGDELVYNQLTEVFESHAVPGVPGRTRVIITPNSNIK
ncbi:Lipopolysaccharide export system protein LptA [Ephemeroptericola cinctiostellae]|uniref:Lipopolysaccharide export system protein LptA n=1 Tax=Ephemeroptericola cinctiostellae TaxID=2268024 RepID=A0A345D8T9_9BURK|nr:lipopolysaccharide transport periplasmic protein LptA [Ephemeroptericola cinctiostellae]AXF84777.1 Lipopolysaccharide export system protein LptA [Ephemeroptericola cinctiostellae]